MAVEAATPCSVRGMDRVEAGRLNAAKRWAGHQARERRGPWVCEQCGITFDGLRHPEAHKFCSYSCAGKAHLAPFNVAKALNKQPSPERVKSCVECGEVKPRSAFPLDVRGKASSWYCLACLQIRNRRREEYSRRSTLSWQKSNRARCYAGVRRYDARKRGAPISDLTLRQWRQVLQVFKYCCAYCGSQPARLEQDHVLPLSRGGAHTVGNVVPACRHCNASKSDRTIKEWVDSGAAPQGLTA